MELWVICGELNEYFKSGIVYSFCSVLPINSNFKSSLLFFPFIPT